MKRDRWLGLAVLVGMLVGSAVPVAAQEEPKEPPPSDEAPAAAPTEKPSEPAATKKEGPGFWGDHFALYLAAGGGVGSSEQLESSMRTSSDQTTTGKLDMDLIVGDVAIGWKLPNDRGSFRIDFMGFSEDSSTFEASGNKQAVITTGVGTPDQNLEWWHVRVSDGTLTSTLSPPNWTDTNGNTNVDLDEITYPTSTSNTAQAPEDFQNRLQTYDFLFYRSFGGRVWSAQYTAGLRYLLYEGNVPAAAWLSVSAPTTEAGFTDGIVLPLLYLRQETTGLGPTGSLELNWNLFKRRLVFFGMARFAFLFENLEVDSGEFNTLVYAGTGNQTNVFMAPARLAYSTSHGAWNIGARLGARVRIVEGFHVEAYAERMAYHDVAVLPYEIQVPNRQQQIARGTTALYNTQNLELDSFHLVAGFQF